MRNTFLSACGYCAGGLFFLVLAFISGAQKNPFFGCVSFVAFFTVAVMLFQQIGKIFRDRDE